MGSLTISNKTLEKYFNYLKYFDDNAKKNLIKKLSASLKTKPKKEMSLNVIFGAWEDSRSSDEIIEEIKSSRIEKQDNPMLP